MKKGKKYVGAIYIFAIILLIIFNLFFYSTKSNAYATTGWTEDGEFYYMDINNKIYISEYLGSKENVKVVSKIGSFDVQVIESGAFEGKNIIEVDIPDTVRVIEKKVFANSTVEEVILSNNMDAINEEVFLNCSKLKEIAIPESVVEVKENAFSGCSSLTNVYLPLNVNINENVLANTNSKEICVILKSDAIAYNDMKALEEKNIIKSVIVDDQAPTLQISAEDSDTVKKSQIVRIKADEPIQRVEIEGERDSKLDNPRRNVIQWDYVGGTNRTEIEAEIFKNIDKTIEVKDLVGNKQNITITINNVDDTEINNYNKICKEGKIYLENIKPNEKISDLINNIKTKEPIKIYKDDTEIKDKNSKLATGMKVKVGDKEYTISVNGDLNGDGEVTIQDILAINKYRLNKATLQNEYIIAGDVNDDSNVDIKDIMKINKFRLNKITEL